jgi:Tfp pilus assembly protein FimT
MSPHALPTPPRPARRSRAGHTLAELITVLAVLGVVLGVTVPSAAQVLDTAAVLVARQEATALLALARGHALAAGRATAVTVQATEARLVAHAGADTLRHASWRPLGVALEATRDSLAYGPDGLGVGAANLRLVLRRGAAADTLSVSRLGRVRTGG